MRDAEFTAAAVRNLLSLTAQEVNDLVTGATISGQTLTLPQNDGTNVIITIPTAMAGIRATAWSPPARSTMTRPSWY